MLSASRKDNFWDWISFTGTHIPACGKFCRKPLFLCDLHRFIYACLNSSKFEHSITLLGFSTCLRDTLTLCRSTIHFALRPLVYRVASQIWCCWHQRKFALSWDLVLINFQMIEPILWPFCRIPNYSNSNRFLTWWFKVIIARSTLVT